MNESKLMTAADIAAYLGITSSAAYSLLHRRDFPTVRIGTLLYAVRSEVDVWVARQATKGGYQYE